jgi:hypothetical protein
VSFSTITLCVASQRVFIVVSVYFAMTQSGNFRIKVKVKLSLCLTKHHDVKTYWGVEV